MKSGIYKITNPVNGKLYVGSAVSFKRRKRQHFRNLENNKHCNIFLQRSVNKHGIENHIFKVVEHCEKSELIVREQVYLDRYFDGGKMCFNICPTAYSTLGRKHTEETLKKISKAKSGKNHHNYGKKLSKETRDKVSEKLSGENHPQYGKKQSKETIERRSKANKKSVEQWSKDGEFIKKWDSAISASRELGIHNSNIGQCCKGKLKTCGGFIWKYAE